MKRKAEEKIVLRDAFEIAAVMMLSGATAEYVCHDRLILAKFLATDTIMTALAHYRSGKTGSLLSFATIVRQVRADIMSKKTNQP